MSVVVPPRGTKGPEFPKAARFLFSVLQGPFHLLFGLVGDKVRIQGRPLLELETLGAKTNAKRSTFLAWFPDTPAGIKSKSSDVADAWVVVASNAGSPRHPAWLLNMAKHPDNVWITTGRRRIKVVPETLEGDDRDVVWQAIISVAQAYANYQRGTDRVIPLIRLKPE